MIRFSPRVGISLGFFCKSQKSCWFPECYFSYRVVFESLVCKGGAKREWSESGPWKMKGREINSSLAIRRQFRNHQPSPPSPKPPCLCKSSDWLFCFKKDALWVVARNAVSLDLRWCTWQVFSEPWDPKPVSKVKTEFSAKWVYIERAVLWVCSNWGRSGQIEGYRVFQGCVWNGFVYLALKNLQKSGFY